MATPSILIRKRRAPQKFVTENIGQTVNWGSSVPQSVENAQDKDHDVADTALEKTDATPPELHSDLPTAPRDVPHSETPLDSTKQETPPPSDSASPVTKALFHSNAPLAPPQRKLRQPVSFSNLDINHLKNNITATLESIPETHAQHDENASLLPETQEPFTVENLTPTDAIQPLPEGQPSASSETQEKAACRIQAWWRGSLTRMYITGSLIERRLRFGSPTLPCENTTVPSHKYRGKPPAWSRVLVHMLCTFLDSLKEPQDNPEDASTMAKLYNQNMKRRDTYGIGRTEMAAHQQLKTSETYRRQIEQDWNIHTKPSDSM